MNHPSDPSLIGRSIQTHPRANESLKFEVTRVLTDAALKIEAYFDAEERSNGRRLMPYAKEKAILQEALFGSVPSSSLNETLLQLDRAVADRFSASLHCWMMRQAETAHDQEVHQNTGLLDAMVEVFAPLQFVGNEAERLVAIWFWDRHCARLQAECTGAPT